MKSPAGPALPPLAHSEWDHCDFQGSWVAGGSAGGSRNSTSHWKNPRFLLSLGCHGDAAPPPSSPGVDIRVSLRQDRPDADLYAIGFHVYKVCRRFFSPRLFSPFPSSSIVRLTAFSLTLIGLYVISN